MSIFDPILELLPSRRRKREHVSNFFKQVADISRVEDSQFEELDKLITSLDSFFRQSLLPMTKGQEAYPFEHKVGELKERFNRQLNSHVASLMLRTDQSINFSLSKDIEFEQKRLDEAKALLSELKTFCERWTRTEEKGRIPGFEEALKKKEAMLQQFIEDHKKELELEKFTKDVGAVLAIANPVIQSYSQNFLNEDGKNLSWFGQMPQVSGGWDLCEWWAPVKLVDDANAELGGRLGNLFVLEPLRRVPEKNVGYEVRNALLSAANEAVQRGLLTEAEKEEATRELKRWYSFCDKYSSSEGVFDSKAQARKAWMSKLGDAFCALHKIEKDVAYRQALKSSKQKEYMHLFVSHLTQIERKEDPRSRDSRMLHPLRFILEDGFLASGSYLKQKGEQWAPGSAGGTVDDLREICMSPVVEVQYGNCGFIFPLTVLFSDCLFYELCSSQGKTGEAGMRHYNEFHLFNKRNIDAGCKIDINYAVMLAPKNENISFKDTRNYTMTVPQYVEFVLKKMSKDPESWFYKKSPQDWIAKHCIFYDEYDATILINRVKQNYHLWGRFMSRALLKHGLSICMPISGELKTSQVTGVRKLGIYGAFGPRIDGTPERVATHALTLFEWDTKGKKPEPAGVDNAKPDAVDKLVAKNPRIILQDSLVQLDTPNQRFGSNVMWVMRDKDYNKWYVKSENQYQARASIIAANLYRALGYKVPEMRLVVERFGAPAVYAAFAELKGLKSLFVSDTQKNPQMLKTLKKEFLVALWLKNWDSGKSNNLETDGKDIFYVDFGGALYHRAQSKNGFKVMAADKMRTSDVEAWLSRRRGSDMEVFEEEEVLPSIVASFEDKLYEKTVADFWASNEVQKQLKVGDRLNTSDPDLLESARDIVSLSPRIIRQAVFDAGFWSGKCEKYLTKALLNRQRGIKKLFKL